MAHQVVKHGKPITEADEWQEQQREAQERRDKRKEQRLKREQATKALATFSCSECINYFSNRKELDDHIYKCHTFICCKCHYVSKTQQEMNFHIDLMHNTIPQKPIVRLPEDEEMVHDWRHRTMLEDQQREIDRWKAVKERKRKRSDSKEDTEDDIDKDPDYIQSEEGSSQDPLYEPSKKELRQADKE